MRDDSTSIPLVHGFCCCFTNALVVKHMLFFAKQARAPPWLPMEIFYAVIMCTHRQFQVVVITKPQASIANQLCSL